MPTSSFAPIFEAACTRHGAQALEARLRDSKKLTVMRRYFGVARGPADLSSNKAYRRTWGKRGA